MDSLTLTIIGGVVAGVIILFLEYGYFQKKKGNSNISSLEENAAQVKPNFLKNHTEIQSIRTNDESKYNLPWTEAIAEAIESFRILHVGRKVELARTVVKDKRAYLEIWVWNATKLTSYDLTIDKSGEILEISQNI